MEVLYSKYKRLLSGVSARFERSLTARVNWKSRAILIEGSRGTGKSTLMLQYAKSHFPINKSLYITLDDLYFRQHDLLTVVEMFYNDGGRHLLIDEVHKYEDWQSAVKNIYDFYPDLQLIISGSSILALQRSNADLSRRVLRYRLPELSLREFVSLKHNILLPDYELNAILKDHEKITKEILQTLPSPLAVLKEYFNYGAYPFFLEGENEFPMRLSQLINVIIDYDLPEAKAIEISTQARLKKLLYIISTSVPFQPNITRLAEQTGTSRARLLEMLHVLHEAQLIRNLRSSAHGISLMNKPEKIFLSNTSLITTLAEEKPDKGNLRETFFLSQLQNAGVTVTYPKQGDFLANGKYVFEIGGRSKNDRQISGEENAFIVADDLEQGYKSKIPLWLFGFLY